jgi:REP element-mobilizing transposase RayT
VFFPFFGLPGQIVLVKLTQMGEGGYKIRNKGAIHFVTFAVVEWIDVFTRKIYSDILLDSIRHCQDKRGLELYAWCLMSSHVHLIASAKQNDLSEILRDLKKFTSKQIIGAIELNGQESRRDWMLRVFREQGTCNSRNSTHQFWRQDNQPKELYSAAFTAQKINYIHNNPVVAGIVDKAEDYVYSSARDYFYQKKCGLLEVFFL